MSDAGASPRTLLPPLASRRDLRIIMGAAVKAGAFLQLSLRGAPRIVRGDAAILDAVGAQIRPRGTSPVPSLPPERGIEMARARP